jgi:hypothetical protein
LLEAVDLPPILPFCPNRESDERSKMFTSPAFRGGNAHLIDWKPSPSRLSPAAGLVFLAESIFLTQFEKFILKKGGVSAAPFST